MKLNETLINVRFSEIDSMNLAHNSVYYIWFEEGRFDFAYRVLNFTPETLNKDILLPVIKSSCKYLSPIRIGDTLLIETKMHVGKTAKLSFYYTLTNEERNIRYAIGKTEHALITPKGKMFLQFPPDVKELFYKSYESNKEFYVDDESKKELDAKLNA